MCRSSNILFQILCIIVCSSTAQMDMETIENTTIQVHTLNVKNDSKIAHTVNQFGFNLLLEMMHQHKDENIVISPASVAGLLAMTLLGSVGNTYKELANVLGFSQDVLVNRNNHEEFGELLQRLNSNDTTSKTLYADAIFIDEQTELREVFRNYLSRVYRGEANMVDFRHNTEVRTMINEWVKSHTEGQIENFLKQSLPENTKVALLSALYFSGQWATPFIPEYTMKMPFKKPNNEIMADLMLNLGEFNYLNSKEAGLHMIALPYNDSTTTMYVLKPWLPKKIQLMELMERLNYSKIDELISQMTNKKAVIRLPKMELQSNVNLKNALKAIGVESMFTPAEANFALMINGNTIMKSDDPLINDLYNAPDNSTILKGILNNLPNPGVHVDSIIHDVKITINEYGTEAVAATSGILARSAEMFYADSPFYMFIRNEKTKLITFSAVIFDPTA